VRRPSNEIEVVLAGLGVWGGIRAFEMAKISFSGEVERERGGGGEVSVMTCAWSSP